MAPKMKRHIPLKDKIGYLLLPLLLLSQRASADPLNGGLGDAFALLLVVLGVLCAIIIAGLVLSIISYSARHKAPAKVAWFFVILGKAITVAIQYGFSSSFGYSGILSLPANISLILMLAALEPHLAGRKFMMSYIFRSALSYSVVLGMLYYVLGISRFGIYSPYFVIGVSVLLLIGLVTWQVYRLLSVSNSKGIKYTGYYEPMLWGIMICATVYFMNIGLSFFVQFRTIMEHPDFMASMLLGVYPQNIINFVSWVIPGLVAYGIYDAQHRQQTR